MGREVPNVQFSERGQRGDVVISGRNPYKEAVMTKRSRLKKYIVSAVQSAGTPFQALIFLSSLRDAYTGRYVHEGWGAADPNDIDEVHTTVQEFHESLFAWTVRLPVVDLAKILRHHFSGLDAPERQTCLMWLAIEPFRDLIPERCSAPLREFFVSQIKAALEVLCRTPDWMDLAAPIESPPLQLDRSPLLHWLN